MAKKTIFSVLVMAVIVLTIIPGEINAQDASTASADLPPRWVAAVQKMIKSLMESPTDEVYTLVYAELVYFRPTMDTLLKDYTEDRKASFAEELLDAITKAAKKRSRVPLRHRLSNAALRVIVDHMGKLPSKKVLNEEMIAHLKQFSEKLIVLCRSDSRCKRFL